MPEGEGEGERESVADGRTILEWEGSRPAAKQTAMGISLLLCTHAMLDRLHFLYKKLQNGTMIKS